MLVALGYGQHSNPRDSAWQRNCFTTELTLVIIIVCNLNRTYASLLYLTHAFLNAPLQMVSR